MALRSSALLLVGSIATAAAAVGPDDAAVDMQDGCIHMQIVHSTNTNYFSKRAVELSLANRSDVAYYAKLNIGSPAQPQFVQLDTGSFELWVNPTCSGLSTGDTTFCEAVGSFEPGQSSTFESLGTTKQLRYGIGVANITYVRDNIALPGTSSVLQQTQFGVATATSQEFSGILGIGYGLGLATRYPNFVDELALQNITQVKAFSLALGSKAEQEGVIVFGGVDTAKFAGPLARLPITPSQFSPDGVPRYWINMTSLALTAGPATAASHTYPASNLQVFLDSGSTLTLLPTPLANAIAADFGNVAGPDSNGFFAVDCSFTTATTGSLDFAFAGVTIRVPFDELIRKSNGQCMLGIQANTDFVLLGDTFLRSAYVVIDQADNNVWMAQYVNCGSSPAALLSAVSLSTLTGSCSPSGSQNDVSPSSSASVSSPTASPSATSLASPSAARPAGSASATRSGASSPSSDAGSSSSSTSSSASFFAPATRASWLAMLAVSGTVVGTVLHQLL